MELQDLKINRSPKAARRRNNRWAPKILPLAAAAALLGLTWPWLSRMLDQLNLPEVQALVVTESNPASAAAVRGTAANGYIVAARRAALSSDVPGRIVELNVQEGSVVKKGD
ncbi:MAG: biotin/lipoyl-binding protein, partial [Planctomycetota bacterium]|nr:biotin/lipoyl-binding protein [Planctomycetota bacterium]